MTEERRKSVIFCFCFFFTSIRKGKKSNRPVSKDKSWKWFKWVQVFLPWHCDVYRGAMHSGLLLSITHAEGVTKEGMYLFPCQGVLKVKTKPFPASCVYCEHTGTWRHSIYSVHTVHRMTCVYVYSFRCLSSPALLFYYIRFSLEQWERKNVFRIQQWNTAGTCGGRRCLLSGFVMFPFIKFAPFCGVKIPL